jgi:hypothetical protein
VLTPVVAVAGLVACQYVGRAVYDDAPVSELRHMVPVGPFRGIATSPAHLALLLRLASDLPKLVNPDGKILCYPNFAAGYLMTPMRPASPHCWVGGVFDRHARWYAERADPRDVILRMRDPHPVLRSLDEAALARKRLAIQRREYTIYTGAP